MPTDITRCDAIILTFEQNQVSKPSSAYRDNIENPATYLRLSFLQKC